MIFKSITIQDKEVLDPYLINNKYGICEFSFSNIFMWRHFFKATYSISKGYLVILTTSFSGEPYFCMPLYKDDEHCELKEIISDMIEYSRQLPMRFGLLALTFEMLEELRPVLPSNFIVPKADIFDYIYTSEDLITLKGKKFHAKRNHINKFNSLYSYEYVDIKEDNIHLCKRILQKWCEENDLSNSSIKNEVIAVNEALDNFTALDIKGGALLVDGAPVAFSMGRPINNNIFGVHAEKALYSVEGVYSKINQEFAAHNCGSYPYINREEDLGIPGLRKSKMSYNPVLLLYKHMGYLE